MFIKYPSLINHYQQKQIDWWLLNYPELEFEETFIVTEKIHGANVALIFSPHEPLQVSSRNQLRGKNDSFYDIWSVIENLKPSLDKLQEWVDENRVTVHLYGEVFGPGVQKGVYYGEYKRIRFFDVRINGVMQSPEYLIHNIADRFNLHIVPIVAMITGLSNVLATKDLEKFNTLLTPTSDKDNFAEGVVIKPYHRVYTSPRGSTLAIKWKSEQWSEVSTKKSGKPKSADPNNELFKQYITENRVDAVFSKEGQIQEKSELGKYISLVLQDAIKDFTEDNQELVEGLDKKGRKSAFNVGGTIAHMLMKRL
jgi:Rnl2 family RNA ligase